MLSLMTLMPKSADCKGECAKTSGSCCSPAGYSQRTVRTALCSWGHCCPETGLDTAMTVAQLGAHVSVR